MMRTAPIGPVNLDPAFAAATEALATYTSAAAAARGDSRLTPLAKAEQITAAWERANQAITAAWSDLCARRAARLAELEALVPVGPNIPADASAADRAVMLQVWRATLDQARVAAGDGSSDAGLRAMLADAERFNDDTLRRAVLTAAIDSGQSSIVDAWCSQAGLSDELAELVALRATIAGHGDLTERLFSGQAFRLIDKPAEAYDLPRLLEADAVTRRDANRVLSPAWR